ncbi:MAG: heme anaerobic degradation radical SAM methyltransferase ChuW/HutW [Deltaproteobacteria bacterium]|nr:heme anaerobic degradation radical SAM methyltransferase ChuW/HutW [Deltaproteobacteria bacterium]MBW2019059.1 heme anaerobic degradation radical SAM methyltransferase ChuW/HutW [Deltaproteobacteria bacterium]MBW2073819.1 heme anaerobic degradation radical SAM methyltransferase ChuW/HutW [Deltaproteobacteria bacterium]RLB82931.1 MAG: heme anaerobic degradation radical SAM methyltransferase ChuW/HutW [Deltaproteobacteria bacterium]
MSTQKPPFNDNRRFLANETDNPLHEAFDHKMTVHAMPKGESIRPEKLPGLWADVMSAKDGSPIRTIYIHIPFCEGHCLFCGFYQNAYRLDLAEQYVEALIREMELTAGTSFINARPFQAVYFGGGTPTALPAESLTRLVSTVKTLFPLSNDCEITLEGRIYNFAKEKIEAALSAGINRFSLGVQTFDTRIRKRLGRREPRKKVIKTLTYLRDLGKAVAIIDLIYGLPDQSLEIWEDDIRTFLSLELDGCDLYQLSIFRGGLLEKSVAKGSLPRPATLKEQADYYVRGVELMEAAHYRRISMTHWARMSRERSLYNLFSRGRGDCVPLGSGAGGWLRNYFFFVEGDLKDYFSAIKAGRKPLSFGVKRPQRDFLFRDISYQMELGYCDLEELSKRHDLDLLTILRPIISQWEKVDLIKLTDGCLYLTRPGEFWAVNLAQMLIDRIQKDQ